MRCFANFAKEAIEYCKNVGDQEENEQYKNTLSEVGSFVYGARVQFIGCHLVPQFFSQFFAYFR